MAGKTHEIRDPIHVFIKLDSDERRIFDSAPFQRLRSIHQLATTYLIYPGATHKRFEHSLGVMELATRIYDVVTNQKYTQQHESVRKLLEDQKLDYWRSVLRMAALCHDIGHLPFSHAAELDLLPAGTRHEHLSRDFIRSGWIASELKKIKIEPEDVAKLAVGAKYYDREPLTTWETILTEIITGDAFGADRMDYLLRDSHHAGVAYGRFDHFRLIDTLRILPRPTEGSHDQMPLPFDHAGDAVKVKEDSEEPTLGIEQGGLQSAESLLWARYLMYSQLYLHPVRRIYDIHLKEFLEQWLPGGRFPVDLAEHLRLGDSEVLVAIREAAEDPSKPGHEPARRFMQRGHFRLLYEQNDRDQSMNADSLSSVYKEAVSKFGDAAVRRDGYNSKIEGVNFPVLTRNGSIDSSIGMSRTLKEIPATGCGYVFIDPKLQDEAKHWLEQIREKMFGAKKGE